MSTLGVWADTLVIKATAVFLNKDICVQAIHGQFSEVTYLVHHLHRQ